MKHDSLFKKLIFAAIFFIVAGSSFGLLYWEIYRTEQKSSAKLNEWKLEASRREEIKSLDSMMKRIAGEKSIIETHFAESKNPVPFLDAMERLASSVGAQNSVSSITLSKDGNSLVVGMVVNGSFESFYKFLTLLENSPYGLEFMSLNLTKTGEAGVAGLWSGILKVKLLTFVK